MFISSSLIYGDGVWPRDYLYGNGQACTGPGFKISSGYTGLRMCMCMHMLYSHASALSTCQCLYLIDKLTITALSLYCTDRAMDNCTAARPV